MSQLRLGPFGLELNSNIALIFEMDWVWAIGLSVGSS